MNTRSIGSLNTWEPTDKSFSKHLLTEGIGEVVQCDGAVCLVALNLISEVSISEENLGGYKFGEDVEITIGEGDTILADRLDQVFMNMKEGELSYINAKFDANGEKVTDLDLKKQNVLKFNANLKSFSRAAKSADLEQDERLEIAQHHKDKGTDLFRENRLDYATKRYNKALGFIVDMDKTGNIEQCLREQQTTLKYQCYLNLAACMLKRDDYKAVINHCSEALSVQVDNVKGLFRRGQAYLKLHQYDEARADFRKALEIEPDNKAVCNQLRTLDAMILKEKQIYQKMFS